MTNHGLVSRAWVKEGKPGNIVDMKCNCHIIIMQLSCLTILILILLPYRTQLVMSKDILTYQGSKEFKEMGHL